jgi:hypothetical protein
MSNIQLKEDGILVIQLLCYDKPTPSTDRFFFLEMSTLQATTLLEGDRKINSINIFSYTPDNRYLDQQTISTFATVAEFNDFFFKNAEYYIADCQMQLENNLEIRSHDDGEVSVELISGGIDSIFIERLFYKFKLDKSLIDFLKSKPGYYFSIDANSKISDEFATFDEYVERRR